MLCVGTPEIPPSPGTTDIQDTRAVAVHPYCLMWWVEQVRNATV